MEDGGPTGQPAGQQEVPPPSTGLAPLDGQEALLRQVRGFRPASMYDTGGRIAKQRCWMVQTHNRQMQLASAEYTAVTALQLLEVGALHTNDVYPVYPFVTCAGFAI